jgi:anti-sigma factor RsiW
LNQALKALHADRARIDKQIEAVTSAISALGGAPVRAAKTAGRRGRRKMNAAQKKAVSLRMKAYWAKRRGAK